MPYNIHVEGGDPAEDFFGNRGKLKSTPIKSVETKEER